MPGLMPLLLSNPIVFFLTAVVLVIALTIHEFAHAWVADRLGDPTPRTQGRVTLNPLAHLDLLGTAMLFLIGFGWGKPVQFDPYNLRHPVRDAALIAFAGPASNLIMALLLAVLLPAIGVILPTSWPLLIAVLQLSIFYNVMLAVFNLVPIHPLDGGKIVSALLPQRIAIEYDQFLNRYGMFLLLALLIPWNGTSPLSALISPPIDVLSQLFLQLSQFVFLALRGV